MSIYENTPAYCELAAHIAEKAMPICKGMAKLYLMFHEKTTTVFERRKNMKKILSFVLVFAMIMAVASAAYAISYSGTFSHRYDFGPITGKKYAYDDNSYASRNYLGSAVTSTGVLLDGPYTRSNNTAKWFDTSAAVGSSVYLRAAVTESGVSTTISGTWTAHNSK